jgi:hypothetical protein
LRANQSPGGFSAISRRGSKDPIEVAGYARVGGRAGDGFVSFDDQEDGIRRRARELRLSISDDAWLGEPDASRRLLHDPPEVEETMARIEDPNDPAAAPYSGGCSPTPCTPAGSRTARARTDVAWP